VEQRPQKALTEQIGQLKEELTDAIVRYDRMFFLTRHRLENQLSDAFYALEEEDFQAGRRMFMLSRKAALLQRGAFDEDDEALQRRVEAEAEELERKRPVELAVPVPDRELEPALVAAYRQLVYRLDDTVNPNAGEQKAALRRDAQASFAKGDEGRLLLLLERTADYRTAEPAGLDQQALLQRRQQLSQALRRQQGKIDSLNRCYPFDHAELLADEEKGRHYADELRRQINIKQVASTRWEVQISRILQRKQKKEH
jgi:hypothetical protein